jgi:LysM repeat protein
LLAPLALVAFAIALFAVVLGSGGGDDEGASPQGARSTTTVPKAGRGGRKMQRRTYTVQSGDTLAGIAEKTGVSVQTLQELNPQLDPQALVSGQKIKLRD